MFGKVINTNFEKYEEELNKVLNLGKYRRMDILYCDGDNIKVQVIFDELNENDKDKDMDETILSDSLSAKEKKELNKYLGEDKKSFSSVNYWLKKNCNKSLTVTQFRACGYQVNKVSGYYYVWKEKKNETN